jgi:hypothetical protein
MMSVALEAVEARTRAVRLVPRNSRASLRCAPERDVRCPIPHSSALFCLEHVVPRMAADSARDRRAMLAASAGRYVVAIVPAGCAAATHSSALHRIEGPPGVAIAAMNR